MLGCVSVMSKRTLESLDGGGKGTEGVTIQEIGRLVEDDDVGKIPETSSQHHLHLLTTYK